MLRLRSLFRLLPLFLLVLAASCQRRRAVPIPAMKKLEGTWLLSREENSEDILVYRPNTYAFPPSRGRTGFAIKPYGRFEQFDIAPTDGLAGRPGAWTIDRGTHLRVNLTEGPDPSYTLEIVSLDTAKRILKVRRLP
ncbi:hypothetical protein Q3A66_07610 [Hymenobacter sp. BT770]|uniref:hypothetical protein n=1 Tax=Hymenobacter sp. BT770 TaxID=2886942 RepID=UPI001D10AD39|nr:hypothetical protein [Hymenobacter sp. BT770]MCC3152857.1 hypothetical protein [Hymenobacter sp. BT770]MDO3414932.1 hypothetical protein [Hymenobacter sp. BT770]